MSVSESGATPLSPVSTAIGTASTPMPADRAPHPVIGLAAFVSLCAFLATQAYTIPVLLVGPSWAVWPMPTDFATVALAATAFLLPRSRDERLRGYLRGVGALFAFASASFFLLVIVPTLVAPPAIGGGSVGFGTFHVLRLAEFWVAFAAAQRVPLSPGRLVTLRWVALAVLAWLIFSVVVTYLDVIAPHQFAPQIPKSLHFGGPWYYYATIREGVGTVGYNHAYTAMQVTMMTGLALQLGPRTHGWRPIAVLLASLVAVFMTGSRAGLAAHLLFAVGYLASRPAWLIGGGVAAALLVGVVAPSLQDSRSDREMMSRQLDLADPFEGNNLSGRNFIWKARLDWLNENPRAWAVGSGLGGTADTGGPAHMMPLQIVAELGLVGLALVCVAFGRLLLDLWAMRGRVPALFWCTIGLLASSLTQETFYPEPAMGQFLGLYLVALAITLRQRQKAAAAPAIQPETSAAA
ncbi:MAG TPA: O-antigen ligase family protein [Vulgatibacter sp.]